MPVDSDALLSCGAHSAHVMSGYQVDERLRRRNTETSPARRASGLEGDTCLDDSPDHFSGICKSCQLNSKCGLLQCYSLHLTQILFVL